MSFLKRRDPQSTRGDGKIVLPGVSGEVCRQGGSNESNKGNPEEQRQLLEGMPRFPEQWVLQEW